MELTLDLGTPNPKQRAFCLSRAGYIAYGGARGGGKSHILRIKAVGGALRYPGIRILVVRRSYTDLERSLLDPLLKLVPGKLGKFNVSQRALRFVNGSVIRFGHYQDHRAAAGYQGPEYDWIFIDEATQFTEEQFRILGGCLRGTGDYPRRIYLTCNPGGVGHMWVRRLFIDRDYRPGENPEDYVFIPATVEDNRHLMERFPDYLRLLDLLPEHLRAAHRYGDWNALAGQYFHEFRPDVHVARGLTPRKDWALYRAIDYGLDRLACLFIGVDQAGRAYVYRELEAEGLIVSEAAKRILEHTGPGEPIVCTLAPPDLWSTQKDTGRTMAQIFAQHQVPLCRVSSARVQGWLNVKEYLKVGDEGLPGLVVDASCQGLIRCLTALQHSEKNPSDVSTQPHEITHLPDALRYFCSWRPSFGLPGPEPEEPSGYDRAMTGEEPSPDYLNYF